MGLSIRVDGVEITFEHPQPVIKQVLEYILMERVYPDVELKLRWKEPENEIREYLRHECEVLGGELMYELLGIASSVYEEIKEALREREDDVPF